MTDSYKGSGQPERAKIEESRSTYPSNRERDRQHGRRRHINAVPSTLRGATAEDTHYLFSAIETILTGCARYKHKKQSFSLTVEQINWGHIASVIRLSSKQSIAGNETARTKYTDIRERVTAPGPRAQEDPSIGTQHLCSLTLDPMQQRLKEFDRDVATIDLEREAFKGDILFKGL